MPTLYNKHHDAPADAVYIGRGSPWGNPFIIGKDGTRDEVCDKYAAAAERLPGFKAAIVEHLRGKDLVCFCAPARCHGEYLMRVANEALPGKPGS